MFRDLLRFPGWVRLLEVAEVQCKTREKLILAPAHAREAMQVSEEFLKGELSGIRSFMGLPEILENLASEVISAQEKANDNSDNKS